MFGHLGIQDSEPRKAGIICKVIFIGLGQGTEILIARLHFGYADHE